MNKIGVIGAGNMGSGIVQKTAQEGLSVVMVDIKPELMKRGLENIKSILQEAVDRKILKPGDVNEILDRIHGTTDLDDVKDCDLVIEAVFEDSDVKMELFKRLDEICDAKTILATNTSSFSVDDLAKATNRPDRFIGLHFFYHPAKNRLLEIIPGSGTSQATTAVCRRFSELTGKTTILVKDSPGFAVNRVFVPWLNEATRILGEGIADIPTIEKAAMEALGIGMGPFELMNVTGVPLAFHASTTLGDELGPFYAPSARLKEQKELNKQWSLEGDVKEDNIRKVADRLSAVIFYTASSLLQEGVAAAADTDLGTRVGLRWRKGPFEIMNSVGIGNAYDLVANLLRAWPSVRMPETLARQKNKGEPWEIR